MSDLTFYISVPIYGGFPVKLRTFIGSAITFPTTATIEEVFSVAAALFKL